MNVVGPCLSPVSYAVQQFHRPKSKGNKQIGEGIVNPMITRRMVYSPPLSRRLKRKRTQFEEETVSLNDMVLVEPPKDDLPAPKKQKLKQASSPISIGKRVKVRFGSTTDANQHHVLFAVVVLTENFGTLVLIKEEKPELGEVRAYSKYWARWRGEVIDEVPILDVIHQAD